MDGLLGVWGFRDRLGFKFRIVGLGFRVGGVKVLGLRV